MQRNLNLQDKYALVTGASSGIGFKIAEDLILAGAYVGAQYFRNLDGANALLNKFDNQRCKLFSADFSKTDQVHNLYKKFMNWSGGRIDILVNNAGEVGYPQELSEITEEAWDYVFQINAKAPFFLSKEAILDMSRQKSGRIINISSIGVKFGGGKRTIHYSAAKAALEAMTKSLAKAGASNNVLVNAIRVGVTDTLMHKKINRTDFSERVELIPLKRPAATSEISSMVLFLASDQGSYVTNSIIDVAGGE